MSEFKFQFMISRAGAPEVPLESLSAQERTEASEIMTANLSRVLSDYYSIHQDEFAVLEI